LSAEGEVFARTARGQQHPQARLLFAAAVARLVGADPEGDAERGQRRHHHQQVQQLGQAEEVGRAGVAGLVEARRTVRHAVTEEARVDARLQLRTPVRAVAEVLVVSPGTAHHVAGWRQNHWPLTFVDRGYLEKINCNDFFLTNYE